MAGLEWSGWVAGWAEYGKMTAAQKCWTLSAAVFLATVLGKYNIYGYINHITPASACIPAIST